MESDSVLSAVIFGISALLMGVFEAGAGAVARALREKRAFDSGAVTEELRERAGFRDKWLSTVIDLPGGAGASFRVAGVIAGAAALTVASAEAGAAWGLRWELILPVVALAAVALAAVSVAARALGARFSNAALPAACIVARWLSYPLSPVLLVYGLLLPKWSGTGENRELDISADPFEIHEFLKPLDKHEADMVRGVVELDKTPVWKIKTPREDVAAASADATLSELADIMITAGHSRIPIFAEGGLDDIIGVAHARDLLEILADGEAKGKTAGDMPLRDPMPVPETKTLEDMLTEFKKTQTHLAIVADEYGDVSGIVTIEDLLEEIVGDIYDEFDEKEVQYRLMDDLKLEVDAMMPLDDFNREMKVDAGTVGNEFDNIATIGGLAIHLLGRVPVVGDAVEYGGWKIEVDRVENRRIVSLKARRNP